MFSSGRRNASQATALPAKHDPVRITHPFHPQRGQTLEVLRRDVHYGEDRVFYRSEYGHTSSLPAAWTSLAEPAVRAIDGNAPAFLVGDLLELVELVHAERRAPEDGRKGGGHV